MTRFEAVVTTPPSRFPPPGTHHISFLVAGSNAVKIPPRTGLPSAPRRTGPYGAGLASGGAAGCWPPAPPRPRPPPKFASPTSAVPALGLYVSDAVKLKVLDGLIGT